MKDKEEQNEENNKAKDIVLALIDALNSNNFEKARQYISDDMKFVGVMGSRDSGKAYMADMEKMKLKYDLKKAFANGDDVCLLYHLNMAGVEILCCGWYHVQNNKVNSLNVIFDPRAVIAAQEKSK